MGRNPFSNQVISFFGDNYDTYKLKLRRNPFSNQVISFCGHKCPRYLWLKRRNPFSNQVISFHEVRVHLHGELES